jgi:7-keto-8-aminopelargonate synthetase-like enzyme
VSFFVPDNWRGQTGRKTVKTLAEPLQQIDRTFVLHRGRKLSYFAGCDYFRMASHPVVLAAMREGIGKFGLNVSASRRTTGNHALYEELEHALAKFFGVEAAVLLSTGYSTNLAVAQTLAGNFTHVLADERAHLSLLDAWRMLGRKPKFFRHREMADAKVAAEKCGKAAKILLLTDGLFSHSGQVAPLADYLRLLPKNTTLLVDDAHGAGTIGKTGRGTAQFLDVPVRRIIQTITLSKAFGVYGGAVLGSRKLCGQIAATSRIFTGNTPLPLPLANAALASLKILRADPGLRRRLALNTSRVKGALEEAGLELPHGPGPIVPITPRNDRERVALERRLLAAGIHPPFIRYPGGNEGGYFRFVISSEHTSAQLDALITTLTALR